VKINMLPLQFEGCDENGEVIFMVSCMGDASVIEINASIHAKDWPKVSAKIQEALNAIHADDLA